jgi:hypothetical protein
MTAGTFTGGTGIIGFESGIILSTGGVQNVVGPNQYDSISQINGLAGDPQLTAIAGGQTYDATNLQFDFTPTLSEISFQYVFASDEYNEYANTQFNDVFAFFLNKIGGTPTNIAIVPGTTSTPVSINNVNLVNNPAYFINNDIASGAHLNTEMDGLTTVLTASATVIPGQTYHIKLAIADVTDSVYDSNVFIKASSFASGTPPTLTAPTNQNATEGSSTLFALGSFSDPDSGPYQVDVNWGDKTPDTTFSVGGATANNTSLGFQPHTYAEEGPENVTVTVTNSANQSNPSSFQVNVADAPLTASTTPSIIEATEGASAGTQVLATFTDANPGASVGDYSVTIHFGDGSGETLNPSNNNPYISEVSSGPSGVTFNVEFAHTYLEEGSYPVTVTINDVGGSSVTATNTTVDVADAPLSNVTGVPVTATEGASTGTVTVATFTDLGNPSNALQADYSASITWGDGNTSPGSFVYDTVHNVWDVQGSNTYAEAGSYNVSVTINDGANNSATPSGPASPISINFDPPNFSTGIQSANFLNAYDVGTITWSGTTGTAGPPEIYPFGSGSPSPPNVMFESDSTVGSPENPYPASDDTMTFPFTTPLSSFSLSRIATPQPDSSIPQWTATFYNAAGTDLGSFGEPYTIAQLPVKTFTFTAPAGQSIAKMTLESVFFGSTYRDIPVDNFVLQPAGNVPLASVATVADVPLNIIPLQAGGGWAGVEMSWPVAFFTDAGNPWNTLQPDYSATINWGDGSPISTGSFSYNSTSNDWMVSGNHAYADCGSYTWTVTINDGPSNSATSSSTTWIVPNAATVPVYATAGVPTGPVTVATFVYPGPGNPSNGPLPADYIATIYWGDGDSSGGSFVYDATNNVWDVQASHTYAAVGTYQTELLLGPSGHAGGFGGWAYVSAGLESVTGVAVSATEGASTGPVTVATFVAPGNPSNTLQADYSASITWGDGSTSPGSFVHDTVNNVWDVQGSNTYAEAGSYNVSVTINDGPSNSANASSTATVADVPLTNVTGMPVTATEGASTGTVTVATFNDPGNPSNTLQDDYSASIAWGDGSSSPGNIVPGPTVGGEVDVLLLTDTTGSMEGTIGGIQTALNGIVGAIASDLPGMNIEYAVADYKNYLDGGNYTAYGVNLDQPFTSSTAAVQAAVNSLWAEGGNDWPESDLKALQSAADDWLVGSGPVGFGGRAGAQKLIVWSGDAPGHYLGEVGADGPPDYYPSLSETLGALNAAAVKVVGLDVLGQGDGIDTNYGGANQEEYLTGGTGGVAEYNVGSGGPSVQDAVVNSITTVVQQTFLVQGSHTYAEAGSYPIAVAINDGPSNSATASTTATVADVPLYATGVPVTATEGASTEPVTVATFTDAGNPSNTLQADYSASIAWGDGSTSPGSFVYDTVNNVWDVQGSNTYAEAGSFNVSVTINDGPGNSANASSTAAVSDPALVVNGVNAAPRTVKAAVWLDGYTSDSSGGGAGILTSLTHAFGAGSWQLVSTSQLDTPGFLSANGFNVVIVSRYDSSFGTSLDATAAANISAYVGPANSPTQGGVVTLTNDAGDNFYGATSGDPYDANLDRLFTNGVQFAANTGHGYVGEFNGAVMAMTSNTAGFAAIGLLTGSADPVHWTPPPFVYEVGPIGSGNPIDNGITFPFTDTDDTTYRTDITGGLASNIVDTYQDNGLPAVMANHAAIEGGQVVNAVEEAPLTNVTVATFVDPGNPSNTLQADYSASITWGDGDTSPGSFAFDTVNNVWDVQGSHTYAEAGSYQVSVTINDGPNNSVTATETIAVADAPLYVTPVAVNATEGAPTGTVTVATFTDAGNPSNTLQADYSASTAWGDGNTSPGSFVFDTVHNVWDVQGSNTYAEAGSYTVTVTINDGASNSANAASTATVADVPLYATGVALNATEEASTGTLTVATFTDAGNPSSTLQADYSASINWGDGNTSPGSFVYDTFNNVWDVQGSNTYAEAGSYHVSVTINDGPTNSTNASSTATVADVPLSICGPQTWTIWENYPTAGSPIVQFNDLGYLPTAPYTPPSDYSASIDWGDGSAISAGSFRYIPSEPGGPELTQWWVEGSHAYAEPGTYVATVTVNDGPSNSATQTCTFTVVDVPLTNVSGAPVTATEGASTGTVTVATFTDGGNPSNTLQADYSASIAWGDGNTSPGSFVYDTVHNVWDVRGSDTYAEAGSYHVSATINDGPSNSATAASTATVADVPLYAAGVALNATEASPTGLVTVATFTDGGNPSNTLQADYSASIAWGDGHTSPGSFVYDTVNDVWDVRGSHTYAEAGGYTVSVTINDGPANSANAASTATVADVPLTNATGVPLSATGGASTGTLSVATFTDGGNPSNTLQADYSASIAWGDGHTSAGSFVYDTVHNVWDVQGSHTYAGAGSYKVIVTINDGPTNSATAASTATVTAVIDDSAGAPGWTTTGTWAQYAQTLGYDGEVQQATPVTTAPTATATWTFTNLPPAQYYKVETTWTTNGPPATSNRASNAPYTISGGTATLPVYVNQQQPPVGVSGNNWTWQELGVYEPTSGTLAVTLANNANGYVIADAVRLEPVPASGPAIMVQAGTGSASDAVVLPTLSGNVQTTVSFGAVPVGTLWQKTFTVFNGGGGTLSVSSVSVPIGYTFIAGSGFTNSGAATVGPGTSAQFVLQEKTSAAGTNSGTVTLVTNDLTTLANSAVAGSFSFPVTGTVISGQIIDDSAGAPGWTTTGTWTKYAQTLGYDGEVQQATPVTTAPTATATWTFTNLPPFQYYKVETTWTALSNRASNVPYTISGGAATLPVYVNQQQPPVGVSGNNWTWQELGVYEASAVGTLAVTLANNANGYVIADAVRIEPVPAAGPAIMVQATGAANNGLVGGVLPTLSSTVQTIVSFGTVAAGTVSQETFTVFNGGGGTLNVSSVTVPAGYTFVAGSGFSGSGTATVPPGTSAQFVLRENASAAGTFSGTVTLATNDLVTLASSAVSGSFSFPVTGTVTPGLVIDDSAGAAGGFSTTGTWSKWAGQSSYYDGDDLQAASAGATATWTFSGLAPGSTYQVYVTWPAQSNRANDVPYTVTVFNSATSFTVDQTASPSKSIAGSGPSGVSWSWHQLPSGTAVDGSFTVGASGTVVVKVSNIGLPASTNTANNVEADAVMLVQTQPELAAGGPGHNPHATALTASEAMPLVHEAEVRWAAAGANVSALGSVQVVVGNLPGAELGESSSVVHTIYLDSNAQGWGWFIDPTPGQDAEFPLRVGATEERATSGPAAGEMDLLTVIMHEMGHFLGHEDLDPQAFPYDLMSADLAVGVRRLPDSAVAAAVAQGSSAQTQAGGQGSVAAEQAQAKDAVFAALAQPQGGTTAGKTAGGASSAWWLLYGEE